MPPRVRERAHAVFASLAAAEAAVHGTTVDDVHFHEVGSTDAILDVVGCCLALESLDVAHLHATPLHLGRGFVHTAHGRLPIPAPATLRLLEGLEAYQTDVRGELVTPTGAALVRGLGCTVGALPPFVLQRIGHGAGRKDREIPNVVRAMLVTPTSTGTPGAHRDAVDATPHQVVQISCNLDDVDPRTLGTLVEELLHGGALDAWIVPVVMKKGRPGFVVETLARPADADRLAQILLSRTTTMGVRMHPLDRRILHRSWIPVDVDGHTVRVKVGKDHGDVVQVTPEFDDVHAVASKTGRAHRWIVHEATARALEVLGAPSARSTPADDGSPAP